jgi:hypothetical protein
MTHLARPLLAVTVGISLLVLAAAPSGATVGTVTNGTATINLSTVLSIDLTGATAPCAIGGAALDVTPAGTTFPYSGTADLAIFRSFTYQGATWFLTLDAASTSVVIDTLWWGPESLTTGPFAPTSQVAIYPEDPLLPCTPDVWSPVCTTITLGATTPILELSGIFLGTVSPPALSGTAYLDGSGRISASGCTAPFAALSNKTLTITDMTVAF